MKHDPRGKSTLKRWVKSQGPRSEGIATVGLKSFCSALPLKVSAPTYVMLMYNLFFPMLMRILYA